MRVVVASEARLYRHEDGSIAAPDPTSAYEFWTRYLAVFDAVSVLARVFDDPSKAVYPVTGRGVDVAPLPGFGSVGAYALVYLGARRAVKQACVAADACIARLPGAVGGLLVREAKRLNCPYGAEIVGDPWEVFQPGVVEHPLRPLLRVHFAAMLRRQARGAAAVAYVSKIALPERYPAAKGTPVEFYSSIDLDDEAYTAGPRDARQVRLPARIISVGSLEQPYKGIDTLLHALKACGERGWPVTLRVLGDGRHRGELEALARRLEISASVTFAGRVSSEAVRNHLDESDIFVLPSRTEGLPRAAIEAMARGLPVIGSTVGGFPELLDPVDMVAPDQPTLLAAKIIEVLTSPARRDSMARRNYDRARNYCRAQLQTRRAGFYGAIAARSRTSPTQGQ